MAEKKFLSEDGLSHLISKIKTYDAASLTLAQEYTDEQVAANKITVDTALSDISTNPVENKAIKAEFQSVESAIASKADKSDLTSGTVVVKEAEHADTADSATTATNANHAATADSATSATTAASATKATQDGNGKVIADTYQTIANATSQHNALQSAIDGKVPTSRTINGKPLTGNITLSASDVGAATTAYVDAAEADANKYTDDAIANLLDNDSAAVDSIMELAEAMEDNADAIDALRDIAGGKADAGHTHDDRYYTESEIDSKISTINTSINGKAAKATTLSGYGITDAYTKTQVDSALSGKADSGHTHDDRYYTEDEIDTKVSSLQSALDGKAAASHGNHVPATQTANNAVFLRNDNTWATVTPANIGAAASGHTHNYAGSSSAGGAANSVANAMTVKLNGGTTEGTNMFTFNGSASKSINITPSSIGAQAAGSYAAASHNHDSSYYTKSQIDSTVSTLNTAISGKAASSHTHSISDISGLESRLAAIEAMLISITDSEIDEICG